MHIKSHFEVIVKTKKGISNLLDSVLLMLMGFIISLFMLTPIVLLWQSPALFVLKQESVEIPHVIIGSALILFYIHTALRFSGDK